MYINRKICPVCGNKSIKVVRVKYTPAGREYFIFCWFCCHHAEARSRRKAFKKFWRNALNAEVFAMEAKYGERKVMSDG